MYSYIVRDERQNRTLIIDHKTKWSLEYCVVAKMMSLDERLKLLSGDSDEQRLVGLLLVTKFVNGDDLDTVRKVFDAIGSVHRQTDQNLRSCLSGLPSTFTQHTSGQFSYLHLALSILAAFGRVPELASLDETIFRLSPTIKGSILQQSVS